ncbi:hypothetical protein MJO28_006519 [Puccinia striiformis f. sp. tritici]|uniref:Uncharacterized protein n=1 Tax=Puccinia striiformis f. sp. tritici TaxID=168172 RepID=A0ACC0EH39_9BASI|nr:hypothetical protein MJO28_006519 [Puccinia striiformis f. sp. tritici]
METSTTRPRPTPKPRNRRTTTENITLELLPQLELKSENEEESRTRRYSQSTIIDNSNNNNDTRKLRNRTSTPLFNQHDQSPTSLFKRIKNGISITPKHSFISTTSTSSSTSALDLFQTTGRSSDLIETVAQDYHQKSKVPLNRSQSDSMGLTSTFPDHHPQQSTTTTIQPSPSSSSLRIKRPATATTPQNRISRSFSQSTKIPTTTNTNTTTTDKLNRSTGYLSSSLLRNHTLDNHHYLSNSDHTDLIKSASVVPRPKHQQSLVKKLRRPRTAGTDVTSTSSSTFNQFYKQPVIEITHKTGKITDQLAPPKKESLSKPLERLNDTESEQDYLIRLSGYVEKSKIPSILASSNQAFHTSVLHTYMHSFQFSHDPLDLSIRKLLMIVDLPVETQQIDRLIEAFSKRYVECNPKLFNNSDQVYILAFSIIMLHTDHFNKSNKAKMSRNDYVKNTRMDGIPIELLEYIYDNITYTPFVYVDPDRDISGQKIMTIQTQDSKPTSTITNGAKDSSATTKGKLDPYQLIAKGSTHELRPDLGTVIPSRNPFSFTGSVSWFDFKNLKKSFDPRNSVIIQVVNLFPNKPNSIFKLIQPDHIPPPSNESLGSRPIVPPVEDNGVLNIRAVKVGLVHLKLDPFTTFSTSSSSTTTTSATTSSSTTAINSGNDPGLIKNIVSKKWKLFCVLLTTRQLILIKDVGLASELQESIKLAGDRNQANPEDQLVVRITGLKPDLVLSLDAGIALLDSVYQRRPCTFRLVLDRDLSLLLGLDDNDDMNSWITHINYAATYKTNKLPFWPTNNNSQYISSPRPSMNERVYTRKIQSTESLQSSTSIRRTTPNSNLIDLPPVSRSASISNSLSARPFDIGPSLIGESPRSSSIQPRRTSNVSSTSLPTHWDLVKAQIVCLEAQILAAKSELNEDLRLARNLAVLTPFQLSTRSKLQQAILPVANRVRNSRCQLSKLVCYREILVRDLALGLSTTNDSVKNTTAGTPSGSTSVHRTLVIDHHRHQLDGSASSSSAQLVLPTSPNTPRFSEDGHHHHLHLRRDSSLEADIRPTSSITRRTSDVVVTGLIQTSSSLTSAVAPPPHHQRQPSTPLPLDQSDQLSRSLLHSNGPSTADLSIVDYHQPPEETPSLNPQSPPLKKHSLSPSTTSTLLPKDQPIISRDSPLSTGTIQAQSSSIPNQVEIMDRQESTPLSNLDDEGHEEEEDDEDDEEVLEETMACLRKVGRHLPEEWTEGIQDPLGGRRSRSTTRLGEDPVHLNSSSTGSSWSIGRTRSATSMSSRSNRDNHSNDNSVPHSKSSTIGSTRSFAKVPFLGASTSTKRNPPPPPLPFCSSSFNSTRTSIVTPTLFTPPPLNQHLQSPGAPSTLSPLPPSSTHSLSKADRAAAKARMLSKAMLVSSSSRSKKSAPIPNPQSGGPGPPIEESQFIAFSEPINLHHSSNLSPHAHNRYHPLSPPPTVTTPSKTSTSYKHSSSEGPSTMISHSLSGRARNLSSKDSNSPISPDQFRSSFNSNSNSNSIEKSKSHSHSRSASGSHSGSGSGTGSAKRFTQAWGLP